MRLTPDLPKAQSTRGRIANGLFAALFGFSWIAFVVAELVGSANFGWSGCGIGLVAGWLFGMWIRRSLGVSHRNLTLGFFIRMLNRGNGSPPRLLESWVESVRGRRLTMVDCRALVAIRGEAMRRWQAYESIEEHQRIRREQDEKILRVLYGGADASDAPSPIEPETFPGAAESKNVV